MPPFRQSPISHTDMSIECETLSVRALCWDNFGKFWIFLESFGTILGVFWDIFGTFLEHFEIFLETFWEVLGTFLEQFWRKNGKFEFLFFSN